MTTEQKKVSLTIETDWATYQYVDSLSKSIEQLTHNMNQIEVAMKERLATIQEMAMTDPTEWLEDVEEEVARLRKEVNSQHHSMKEMYEELKLQYSNEYQYVMHQKDSSREAIQTIEKMMSKQEMMESTILSCVENVEKNIESKVNNLVASQVSVLTNKILDVDEKVQQLNDEQQSIKEQLTRIEQGQQEKFDAMQQAILEEIRSMHRENQIEQWTKEAEQNGEKEE